MSARCDEFRSALAEAAVHGRDALARLADGAHVSSCAACRAALAAERTLERLLAAADDARVPPDLAHRVITALAPERARRHHGHGVEPDEDELDALLERVPASAVPPGLARRVLDGLAAERAPRPRPEGFVKPWRPRLLGVAAALVLALGAWAWIARRGEPQPPTGRSAEAELAALEADAELLAYAAERWELLHDADLDLWLASLDAEDELLVEYADASLFVEAAGAGEAR